MYTLYIHIYIYTPCLIPPYHIISAGTQVFLSRWNRRPVPIPWDVWIVILPWPYSVPWWNTWHMSLPRWRRKVQDDRIFSSSPVTWLEFLLMTASPPPWLHLPEPEFQKKIDDIPTKIVDSFEGAFHPVSAIFLRGSNLVAFFHLSEAIFRVINFHVNIIKRESSNWWHGRREFFSPLLLGMLDDVVRLADVGIF